MIQRKPLREELYREILARIEDGRLPAGHRINESQQTAGPDTKNSHCFHGSKLPSDKER